ncbi:flavin-containing monooxygenase [Modestobacter sp. VKM Ac-2985]|uniref:flavin-containing monooxygenase n=1 Tax=Modestobacter sp. VKM Ac-2985 TaxID=3004139 RepID=UPI0022AB839E|nr:FAD-dependent oxidoreductase [Modestobacter sp. VKM Ac-2985]MCZ2838043.1 NAD(P)-binding domain-containing protein [Modestobacter sp. VKM Ac-2985]
MISPASVYDVLVVGAGQAGLGTAWWLARKGVRDVVVVDAAEVGGSWLRRWESLQLFTPRRFSSLPGMAFPAGPTPTPDRVEMADHLQRYARRLDVPVRSWTPVTRLTPHPVGFCAETREGPVLARHVVLATGPFARPRVPAAAQELDPAVAQLHSADYCRPADLPAGPVLVVGGGNSAAQLAVELSATHEVTVLSPREPRFLPERVLGVSVYWWLLLSGVLNAGGDSWVARGIRRRGDAIIGRELRRLRDDGVIGWRTGRVVGAGGDRVHLDDGRTEQVSAVLWCTGFLPETGWIDVPGALDADGQPVHDRGASPVAGLHWMGLPWQTRVNSSIIDGVDRDARRTARRIARSSGRSRQRDGDRPGG